MHNISKIIYRVKNNDPLFNSLTEIAFSLAELNDLRYAIQNNNQITSITWLESNNPKKQKLQDLIEEKVVNNLINYKYYPSNGIFALFASYAYEYLGANDNLYEKYNIDELKNWHINTTYGNYNNTGYYAILFINHKECQSVLAFRGTKLNFKDILHQENTIGMDIESVIYNKKTKFIEIEKDSIQAINYSTEIGYNLALTGHSLGGWLAHRTACFYYLNNLGKIHSVGFDNPGTQQMFERMNHPYNIISDYDNGCSANSLDLLTWLPNPNIVNVMHKHVGEVYYYFKYNYDNQAFLGNFFTSFMKPETYTFYESISQGIQYHLDYQDTFKQFYSHSQKQDFYFSRAKNWPTNNFYIQDMEYPTIIQWTCSAIEKTLQKIFWTDKEVILDDICKLLINLKKKNVDIENLYRFLKTAGNYDKEIDHLNKTLTNELSKQASFEIGERLNKFNFSLEGLENKYNFLIKWMFYQECVKPENSFEKKFIKNINEHFSYDVVNNLIYSNGNKKSISELFFSIQRYLEQNTNTTICNFNHKQITSLIDREVKLKFHSLSAEFLDDEELEQILNLQYKASISLSLHHYHKAAYSFQEALGMYPVKSCNDIENCLKIKKDLSILLYSSNRTKDADELCAEIEEHVLDFSCKELKHSLLPNTTIFEKNNIDSTYTTELSGLCDTNEVVALNNQ